MCSELVINSVLALALALAFESYQTGNKITYLVFLFYFLIGIKVSNMLENW